MKIDTTREFIFRAISRERAYQDVKWKNNPQTVGEWLLIMQAELDEAKEAWVKNRGDGKALEEILQVISVGVACLEQHSMVERNSFCELELKWLKWLKGKDSIHSQDS